MGLKEPLDEPERISPKTVKSVAGVRRLFWTPLGIPGPPRWRRTDFTEDGEIRSDLLEGANGSERAAR